MDSLFKQALSRVILKYTACRACKNLGSVVIPLLYLTRLETMKL